MSLSTDITGFILAGGESRRLGRDKRLVRIGGETLLERTRGLLREALGREPFLVGNNLEGLIGDSLEGIVGHKPEGRGIEPPLPSGGPLPGCGPPGGLADDRDLVIPDALPGRGPLGGLVAALGFCPTPWALVLAVDFLFLEERDIRRLVEAPRTDRSVVALSLDGRPEPLAALYLREGLPFWRARLFHGQDSIFQGIVDLGWLEVAPAGGPRALRNLNDEGDLILLSGEARGRRLTGFRPAPE